MHAPSVLLVGTGMYVCGKGTSGFGTVLPTLIQAQRDGEIGEIVIAARSYESLGVLRQKLAEISKLLKAKPQVREFPAAPQADEFSYRQALASLTKPACAIIAVPDHLHVSIAEEVMKAGVHPLVVKPLAPTLAEAQQLADMAQARQLHAACDFHKRFDEANLVLRQAIGEGKLGDVRYITVEFSQRRMIQRTFSSWIKHTNVFQYLGVHYADLIYFLTGAKPVRVIASGQPRQAISEGLWRLDSIQALIEWEDAAGKSFTSAIMTNWIDPDRMSALSDQRIMVVGTNGRYDSDQKHRGVEIVTDQQGTEEPNFYFSQFTKIASGEWSMEGYGPRCIRQFLSDVREITAGRTTAASIAANRPSFQETLVSNAVIDAVSQSLLQGGVWIPIEEGAAAWRQ